MKWLINNEIKFAYEQEIQDNFCLNETIYWRNIRGENRVENYNNKLKLERDKSLHLGGLPKDK